MSTASPQPFSDTMTMLWRNILDNLRAPSGVITVIGVPLIFLLLFVYVFGETLGAGLMSGGARDEYLAYITPAVLLMAAASATQMIAVSPSPGCWSRSGSPQSDRTPPATCPCC
jgi:ABC-2 type transport system permease protein